MSPPSVPEEPVPVLAGGALAALVATCGNTFENRRDGDPAVCRQTPGGRSRVCPFGDVKDFQYQGERLTNERAEQIAEETLAGTNRGAFCSPGDRNAPRPTEAVRDDGRVKQRNVLGAELEQCGTDPLTGFFRDGCCSTGPEDLGSHTICAVVTAEFLDHQRSIGNDLSTPRPQYHFSGLVPGDRWCVTAVNWARAYRDGAAAPVVLASTNEAVLTIVPLEVLRKLAVDVPANPGSLEQ